VKTVLRFAWSIAVVAVLICALYAYCYMPLHCNILEKQIEARTLNAYRTPGTMGSQILARTNLEDLRMCSSTDRTNVNDYMIEAANLELLGRTGAAVQHYESALLYDRRPEIYLNLGLDLLEMGNAAAGERALVTAALFNPALIAEIPYDNVRASVQRQVFATIDSWSATHPQQ
jgi:tetratricopeptide (TPR) repeat protein